ncbi:Uu.00g054780.m01.CDS01 [Anthostomella pinea]|uniref:feruloyl esterase n=1 Tax=Anthostomella pinea TaxID=933095 RepID=A0AAI8VXY0_9PEZI|nr:Uu.00g054780.m01.CDS01 [Anthostomella pinea]
MHRNLVAPLLGISSFGAAHTLRQRSAAGCGQSPTATLGELSKFNTTAGREYGVWLPDDYDQTAATPLIVSYHGADGTIDSQAALDKLTHSEFNTDHIVVYLQGKADDPDEPNHTTWEGAPGNDEDDVGFTSDVLDAMTAGYCIDTSRIYATGKSQGGGFVGRLACDADMSKRIAAFAPVSGAYYIGSIDEKSETKPETVQVPCEAGRADVPIMAFHGGDDTTIAYYGAFRSGSCLPAIPNWIQQWAARDDLDETPANTSISGSDNGVVMSFGDGLVTLVYDGDDIGHDWPSTTENSDNGGTGLAAFNASTMIMAFFREHTLS